jgi:adenine-specific DNA-methyltransferase
VIEKTDYSQVVHPDDVEQYIRIVPNQLDHQISAQMKTFHTSLEELGIAVSTGRVVDFRVKHLLTRQKRNDSSYLSKQSS